MKDKKKQIKEIVKLLHDENASIVWWDYYNDDYNPSYKDELKNVAKIIYNAGYRKLPENSVVLSREEAERFRGQTINLKKVKSQERKETAEKIIKWFKENSICIPSDEYINEFAKQFGVEIKK